MKKFITIAAMAAFAVLGTVNASAADLNATVLAELGFTPAQIAVVMDLLGSTTTSDSMLSAHDGVNLEVGVISPRVGELQTCMNDAGFPTGKVDNEFGPNTAIGVMAFQVSTGVKPDGVVGVLSTPAFQAACPINAVVEDEPVEEVPESELSGEGTLTTFEIDDAEDTVGEGDKNVPVLVLTLEAEDGDIKVSRLDFTLVADTGTTNEEDEPWDVYSEITLSVDGDEIASFEADDEDEYLDEDTGEFRFSNLDFVLEEDEEVEITVAVSVMNSVDGADTANAADWNIEPVSIRYFDFDGVATTETVVDEMTAGDDSEHFDIEEEGVDDDADLESNSDNPDAANLLVDEDTEESDDFLVHLFDIEVDDESGDLVVEDTFVDVTISDIVGGAGIAGGQEDVIADIYMTIDGTTIKGEATANGANLETAAIAGAGATTVEYVFEFDEDVTLESDTDYEVEITIEFEGQDGNYVNGVTVITAVDATGGAGAAWEVEGSEDDNILTGNDTSETHTLSTVVPVITDDVFTVDRNEDGDAGTISYEFTLKADGDNDIELSFVDVNDVDGAVDDVRFLITGTDTDIATAAFTKISGDATLAGNVWTVSDGDDATFVMDVTFSIDAGNATQDGTYRVFVDTIEGLEIDETSAGMSLNF